MSRPRYWWYHNVIAAIGQFPKMAERARDEEAQNVIANYSAMPRNPMPSRSTENSAVRALSSRERDEYEAVKESIEYFQSARDGKEILMVVDAYHWKGVHNFETVGDLLHMSEHTARLRNRVFIYHVAEKLGYDS
jgi:RinA family phage transcriptional activator